VLTDVPGIRVGHATDVAAGTGCTVVLPPPGTVGAVDVRGGGPGSRETDLLSPVATVDQVTALLLTGGSAFGLSAAAGVVRHCQEEGLGVATPHARVPIVPAAVIYDLGVTGNLRHPGPDDAYLACREATGGPHEVGSVGAGTGATVGKAHAQVGWCKGGLGAASTRLLDGTTVAALAVVNAFGDVLDERGEVLAGTWAPERGFVGSAAVLVEEPPRHPRLIGTRENTTLVVVATDARLSKPEATHVSRMGQGGLCRAVSPANTPVDGDAVFCLATGARTAGAFVCGVAAAEVVAAAIRDAVRRATPVRGVPTAAERRATAIGPARARPR
jgi:L-aminopeptidase/D-esterase-like protein